MRVQRAPAPVPPPLRNGGRPIIVAEDSQPVTPVPITTIGRGKTAAESETPAANTATPITRPPLGRPSTSSPFKHTLLSSAVRTQRMSPVAVPAALDLKLPAATVRSASSAALDNSTEPTTSLSIATLALAEEVSTPVDTRPRVQSGEYSVPARSALARRMTHARADAAWLLDGLRARSSTLLARASWFVSRARARTSFFTARARVHGTWLLARVRTQLAHAGARVRHVSQQAPHPKLGALAFAAGPVLLLTVAACTWLWTRSPATPAVAVEAMPSDADITEMLRARTGFTVVTQPAGAEILVDGRATHRVTPERVSGFAPGMHSIDLKLAGYYDTSLGAVFEEGATLVLPPVTLRALPITPHETPTE